MINKTRLRRAIVRIPFAVKIYFALVTLKNIPFFIGDYIKFRKLATGEKKRFSTKLIDLYPRLTDKTPITPIEPHYTYHPAWAARVVAQVKPAFHIDVSSFIHFSTLVSAFIPVKFYDYRPAQLNLSGLTSERGDLMALPFPDNSVESISCMHTIEHIGLGRYGDPIDPEGDLKAINELKRVVKPGGTLIFVTPMGGKPHIEFNAHRIYSYDQIMEYFSDMELKEFSLVPDNYKEMGGMVYNASKELVDKQDMGCGCFWFIKK
jgi:hypothetical protein